MSFGSNADQVADDLVGVIPKAIADADAEVADLAHSLILPRTPRRTGRLAAGLRSVAVSEGGFEVSDDVPYSSIVNARTGFASETLVAAEPAFAEVYDRHLQAGFDTL